jgi:hypothetical protein
MPHGAPSAEAYGGGRSSFGASAICRGEASLSLIVHIRLWMSSLGSCKKINIIIIIVFVDSNPVPAIFLKGFK